MAPKQNAKNRCGWAGTDPIYCRYHDREWGTPLHNDKKLFEFLILEGAQAGLSWITILRKRAHYRKVYDAFDPEIIARYSAKKVNALMGDAGIVRNRLKINASIDNAKAYLKIRSDYKTFDRYIWKFVGGKTVQNRWRSLKELPSATPESNAMSLDLRKRGFRFVGATICYAFMQATGMVNDHLVDCFRYREIQR